KSIFMIFLLPLLFLGCKKEEGTIAPSIEVSDDEIVLTHAPGRGELTVRWAHAEWELETADGFLSDFTFRQGGSLTHASTTRIQFTYAENTTGEERTQELTIRDRTTGAEQQITVVQSSKPPVTLVVNPALKYQHITGFGGMLNPAIWLGGNQLTEEDITVLY